MWHQLKKVPSYWGFEAAIYRSVLLSDAFRY